MHVFQAATCMQRKPLFCRLCKCWCFWASVFYKNGHKSRVFAAMNIEIGANLSLQSALFSAFFFTSIGYLDQKLWCFKQDTSHSIKIHFYVFFQNAHHCNLWKNTAFKIFGGLSVRVLGLTLMFVYFIKLVLSWSSLRTLFFLKLDWCTLAAVSTCTGDTCLWAGGSYSYGQCCLSLCVQIHMCMPMCCPFVFSYSIILNKIT